MEQVQKEDLEVIFKRVEMPGIMLTNKKVKKSKQSIQEAFTVLNHNMVLIDQNLRDLLYMMQDLSRVLYVCVDGRINHATKKIDATNERMTSTGHVIDSFEKNVLRSV